MERNQISDANSGARSSRNDAARFDTLPEDCISIVVSHTSPRDACVMASVSKTVKSAAESDLVWEKFLPPEHSSLVSPWMRFSSKKKMYMYIANDSFLFDGGKKRFWLEKGSGKMCCVLSAMDLTIAWSDWPDCWQWKKDPESKFKEVAELREVFWFEIRGKIGCEMLSKGTHYTVYLVFKRAGDGSYGFDNKPMDAQVGFVGKDATKTLVLLEPRRDGYLYVSDSLKTVLIEVRAEPKERGDGWSEVKLGNFYINDGGCDDNDEIEFSIMEASKRKGGLIFQGIEIRPKTEEMVIAK
ncbi:unnamed protein product [Eruca vesicaria subsp. sativa]|uniref:F-box domain-containing protein n=1 Tax=Eruca vesicaria subsp. sativa TaxID=29727 RepID=A0ABC8LUV1_ERUVS|nr:unnamed protein product [Eruca vesicaria subsp. sativa]